MRRGASSPTTSISTIPRRSLSSATGPLSLHLGHKRILVLGVALRRVRHPLRRGVVGRGSAELDLLEPLLQRVVDAPEVVRGYVVLGEVLVVPEDGERLGDGDD
jgi:hypothetical protein